VLEAVSAFRTALDQEARSFAKNACGDCAPDDPTTIGFSFSDPTVTNVWNEPGLFAVGHSTFFRRGSCTVTVDCRTSQYTYTCDSTFWIQDEFMDPLDGKNWLGHPFELPFGSPYPITYRFQNGSQGGGKL